MRNRTIWKNKKRRTKTVLVLCFFIPAILMLSVYAALDIAPFGKESLLTVDMAGQYISYFGYWKEVLTSHASLTYSMSKGLGGNMMGLIAYYLCSPLNLLLPFFSKANLPYFVLLITVLKVSFASLAMGLLLWKRRTGYWSVPLAVSYGLMSYNIVYQQNIMWLDVVVCLPLIQLGLDAMLQKKRTLLYTAALAAACITNYYIAYSVAIYCFLYFLFALLLRKAKWKEHAVLFVRSSLLAGGLAAFLLLPNVLSLRGGKAQLDQSLFTWDGTMHLMEFFLQHVPANAEQVDLAFGFPNVYIGLFPLLLALLYFLFAKRRVREKLLYLVLIVVLISSMYWTPINLVWHGLNEPIWFMYRYSFLYSFLLLMVAGEGSKQIGHMRSAKITAAFLLLMAGVLWLHLASEPANGIEHKEIYTAVTAGLVIVYTVLLLLPKRSGRRRKKRSEYANEAERALRNDPGSGVYEPESSNGPEIESAKQSASEAAKSLHRSMEHTEKRLRYRKRIQRVSLLTVIAIGSLHCAELSVVAMRNLSNMSYEDIAPFQSSAIENEAMIDRIARSEKREFYRIDKNFARESYHLAKNDALLFHYKSLSHYSSNEQERIKRFMGRMGYRDGGTWGAYMQGSTSFADSLLGMAYLITQEGNDHQLDAADYVHPIYTLWHSTSSRDIRSADTVSNKDNAHYEIYYNPYALPFAFLVDRSMQTIDMEQKNLFALQSEIANSIQTGVQLFDDALILEENFENVSHRFEDGYYHYQKIDPNASAHVEFVIRIRQTGPAYAHFPEASLGDEADIFVNDEELGQYFDRYHYNIFFLGDFEQGESVRVRLEPRKSNVRFSQKNFTTENEAALRALKEKADRTSLQLRSYTDDHIEGTVDVPEEGALLFFNVPWEEGWEVKVDDMPVEPVRVLDALMAVPVSAGRHDVTAHFRAPGLVEGALISAASLIGIIVLFRNERTKLAKRQRTDHAMQEMKEEYDESKG